MEPKKRWDGYTSFSYLRADEDYRSFELAEQLERVAPTVVPLDAEQEARAERLLHELICISLHEHGGILPLDPDDNDAYIRQGREFYGFEGMAASGLDAVFENFLDGTAAITSAGGWKWEDVIFDLGMHLADVAHQTTMFLGTSVADIERAHDTGRIALIACIEGAAPIENELDRLDILYGLGVRMIGVAYSESNQLGGGVRDPGDGGLTVFGRAAVTRMNRLGMAIDLSHTGDLTALQTCELSEKPVFLSHSGARALYPEMKLKTDDLLRAVADTGGVIGIEAAPYTTTLVGVPHTPRDGDGPRGVLHRRDGHRPCGVRPRHLVRRPRRSVSALRRPPEQRRGGRPPAGGSRGRAGEPERVPERAAVARRARLRR